jgi:hypothetical protein
MLMDRQDGSYIVRSMDGKNGEVARKFKLSAQPGQRCLIQYVHNLKSEYG